MRSENVLPPWRRLGALVCCANRAPPEPSVEPAFEANAAAEALTTGSWVACWARTEFRRTRKWGLLVVEAGVGGMAVVVAIHSVRVLGVGGDGRRER